MNSPLQTWKYWAFKQFGVSELYNVNLRWTPRHSWAYQRALSRKVPRCWMIYFDHISVPKVASWVSWKGCGQKNRRVQIFRVLVVLTRTLHQKMIGQETRLRCFLILNHLGLEPSNECTWLFVVFFVESNPSHQEHQFIISYSNKNVTQWMWNESPLI